MQQRFMLFPWCYNLNIFNFQYLLSGNALGKKELIERHPDELSIDEEIERLRLPVGIPSLEEAVNDGGEAKAGEIGRNGNGSSWSFEWGFQFCNETRLDSPLFFYVPIHLHCFFSSPISE
uniref:Uncharacterized protein MANES_02G054600 n=1 Tax=Rhizophora mucronata TaxID=61149 RepID=A0A2P2KPX8_RHIMU